MKKSGKIFVFIAVCLMFAFLLTSCSSGEIQKVNDPVTGQPIIQYNEIIDPDDGILVGDDRGEVGDVKIFTFRGHRYIQFDIVACHSGRSGVTHDPECLREDLQRWGFVN